MLIVIGSKSPPKIEAVKRTVEAYGARMRTVDERQGRPFHVPVHVYMPFAVPSGVADQPATLEETCRGACNRAVRSWDEVMGSKLSPSLAFGVESGMLRVHGDVGPPFEFTACAIYDGAAMHLGLSPAFRIPPDVYAHVAKGANLSEASRLAGLTEHAYVGSAEGIIGILTDGRVTRADYTAMAVHMALTGLR